MFLNFFFFFLSFISQEPVKPFNLISATTQHWAGGANGSGRGVNYVLTFKANYSSEKLVIDQFWLREEFYRISAVKEHSLSPEFIKGDTIVVKFTKWYPDDRMPHPENEPETKEVSSPFKYKGAGLLGYQIKNKRKYLAIKAFKELPNVNYE